MLFPRPMVSFEKHNCMLEYFKKAFCFWNGAQEKTNYKNPVDVDGTYQQQMTTDSSYHFFLAPGYL